MLLLCLFILFIRKVYKIFMKCDRDISWINVAECYVVTITILAKNDKCFFDEFLNVNTSYNIFGYVLNLFNIFSSLKIAHVSSMCFSFTFFKWVSLWTFDGWKKETPFSLLKRKTWIVKMLSENFQIQISAQAMKIHGVFTKIYRNILKVLLCKYLRLLA